MPVYDYECGRCGAFRERRPMAESAAPQPCPDCGGASPRMLAAPFLAGSGSPGGSPGPLGGAGRGSWRAMCGFGCTHANCGR
ncbi:MAG: zinc ribbon domain-containing protein [Proteobacteria bacterium]|nr:zinc ribbon domain-containing protein [Pseudomonadota bacterium]